MFSTSVSFLYPSNSSDSSDSTAGAGPSLV